MLFRSVSLSKPIVCSSLRIFFPLKPSYFFIYPTMMNSSISNAHAVSSARNTMDHGWILDSGATNHMTFDGSILRDHCRPRCSSITNANGVSYPVTGAGRVDLTPSLSLEHTLLIPSLSNNLLSAPQVTSQLNCLVLMYLNFCLLQEDRKSVV